MAENSRIQWTEATWNPTTGCDKISDGCTQCYALTLAARLKAMGQPKYQTDGDPRTSGPGFGLAVHEDALSIPLRWRKPRQVFVNSMSDLWHAKVPRQFVERVFAVMAATPKHTYQILTKRPERMARMLLDAAFVQQVQRHIPHVDTGPYASKHYRVWPLPNVWLGTSIEDQEHVGRLDRLRVTPAPVRFVSAEPLLGPLQGLDLTSIGWLIVGGESGRGARPMDLDWVRSLRDQCQNAGVAFFVKQLGSRWGRGHGHHDIDQFPPDLQIREYPVVAAAGLVGAGPAANPHTQDQNPAVSG